MDVGTMLEHYQRHMPKLADIMLKDAFVDNTEWLFCFHEFTDKAVVSICNRFRSCVAQLVDADIVNALFKYRVSFRHQIFSIETFELQRWNLVWNFSI